MRRARGGGRFRALLAAVASSVLVPATGPLLIAAGGAGCGGAGEPGPEARDESAPVAVGAPEGPELANDAWRIVRMATAHGIFTIEVEVNDPETGAEVARELIGPLEGSYDEVLVYIYRPGEATGGNPPVKRVQWTPSGGYDELDYGGSEP
ncbi:MAG: hypothetical protein F4Z04_16375 [Acidobacteria bacterium]|nr:hypothetical protein [Acidobacteriota bacterium]